MALVLGVGVGTFLLLFFLAVLLLIILFFFKSFIGQLVFWIGLIVYIIAFILLFNSPTEEQEPEQDIIDKWYVIVIFAIFVFLGTIVNVASYLLVVLLYQDYAVVIPT